MSKSNYLVWLSSFSRKRWGYCTHSSPSRSLQSNTISSEKRLPIQWIISEISEQLSMLIKLALQQEFELAGYQRSFGEEFSFPTQCSEFQSLDWFGQILCCLPMADSFQGSCSWSIQLCSQKHACISLVYFFLFIGICDAVWYLLQNLPLLQSALSNIFPPVLVTVGLNRHNSNLADLLTLILWDPPSRFLISALISTEMVPYDAEESAAITTTLCSTLLFTSS